MKKLVVFGGSNSKTSINAQLAEWAGSQVEEAEVKVLDLNDYEMPIYGIDKELASGIPAQANQFLEDLASADGIIVSFAEHNGNFSAAYKNIFDWASRAERLVYANKPVFVMATSPGPRGGAGVLNIATSSLPYAGANVVGSFSLPSFPSNFDNGITNDELNTQFQEAFSIFTSEIHETSVKA
ncbi:NAD(P)H-dependent oxidoreductase [Flammeovirga yaeyamensis]|uniref:NAD(P)H-dependent oxidoreductase n=1 Tax=Flammeovirga yaeyamensis TaxID=367791 RepID=A0AAX1N6N3_9BACT|nr:NAD(P)H-dependent oxidoreductase [Flammeovirga yaeyamensis]MBB3697716.1 NAD(P)H-dependent FMN reductase [Flammeovirga yaeyamensis]NMF35926.1 NAD(P)H-dependent oxidoreductase [Flammeovirga yaeyamensis]QWG03124.1 NAD(P)H-dependent oxidoreductase [Flammeovirga yaeyamensis]